METPTPPRPTTSTVAPAGTFAVLSTAPTPVCTEHPSTAATSNGVSAGTLTAPLAETTACSAKALT